MGSQRSPSLGACLGSANVWSLCLDFGGVFTVHGATAQGHSWELSNHEAKTGFSK